MMRALVYSVLILFLGYMMLLALHPLMNYMLLMKQTIEYQEKLLEHKN